MRDINIINVNSTTGKVSIDFGRGGSTVTGRQALIQKVVLQLLNIKGTNMYNQSKGSEIGYLIGGTYGVEEKEILKTLIVVAIDEIQEKILIEQAQETGLTDDELLSSIQVTYLDYNAVDDRWDVRILIRTENNKASLIGI